MTTVKQLYLLQEMDLALDRIHKARAKVEAELSSGPLMGQVETSLEEERERLPQVQGEHQVRQLEVETLRERSTRLEQQLYGGEVTNARDLKSLQQEVENVRQSLEQQDSELLELSVQAEESQQRVDSLAQELSDGLATWKARKEELQAEAKRCNSEIQEASARRKGLVAALDASAVQRYEGLRRAKRGLAVAKVERGLCQACRMAQPTQIQQRVRSGTQTVLCSSCGRMLIPA